MSWVVHHTFAKVYWSRTFSSSAEKEVIRSRMSELRSSLFLWQIFYWIDLRTVFYNEYMLSHTQGKRGRRLHECYQIPDWRPNVSIFGVQFFWKLSFTIPNVTQNNQQFFVQISICVSRCFSCTIHVSILDIIVFFVWSVLSQFASKPLQITWSNYKDFQRPWMENDAKMIPLATS